MSDGPPCTCHDRPNRLVVCYRHGILRVNPKEEKR